MTILGNLALGLAFLFGVWGGLAGFAGGLLRRPDLAHSARRALFALCGALLVAVFSLEGALFQPDFHPEYPWSFTPLNLPISSTSPAPPADPTVHPVSLA